jgi:uncharacterized membrane protein (DUF485 family)
LREAKNSGKLITVNCRDLFNALSADAMRPHLEPHDETKYVLVLRQSVFVSFAYVLIFNNGYFVVVKLKTFAQPFFTLPLLTCSVTCNEAVG